LYDGEKGNPYLDPDAILDKWKEILAQLQKHGKFEGNVYSFDIGQESKWGPQGGHQPIKQLMVDIVEPSFKLAMATQPRAFSTKEWREAKRRTLKLLFAHRVANLRPVAYEHVVDDMSTRGTLESNSGYPDFARRSLPDVKERAIRDARSGEWKTYPAIALFRTYNGKTRLVWMFPMSANLVEGSYFQPLYQRIVNTDLSSGFFAPWKGFEQVRELVSSTYQSGNEIGASDFTSTDAHFQWATSEQVCDVIEQCFQPQFRAGLRESVHRMHSIPLLVGPRRMMEGMHGVSSGSNWTNFIETIFDIILGYYVEILTKGGVRLLYAIGDDMAWVAKKFRESFKAELDDIGKSVGQIIKAEKTMVEADEVKTLQRLFQRGYFQESGTLLRGVYSTIRALKSSVYPERWHNPKSWDSDMFCARQFMILENCVDHPLFDEFVRFVCAGNRHLIPFAKQSRSKLGEIQGKAKLIPGLMVSYNQEKKTESLADFASIRIAASL